MRTANGSEDYVSVNDETHPEVGSCENAITDISVHDQKRKDELQRQRDESLNRAGNLLSEILTSREKVSVRVFVGVGPFS